MKAVTGISSPSATRFGRRYGTPRKTIRWPRIRCLVRALTTGFECETRGAGFLCDDASCGICILWRSQLLSLPSEWIALTDGGMCCHLCDAIETNHFQFSHVCPAFLRCPLSLSAKFSCDRIRRACFSSQRGACTF